jgi:hypothetical protein
MDQKTKDLIVDSAIIVVALISLWLAQHDDDHQRPPM